MNISFLDHKLLTNTSISLIKEQISSSLTKNEQTKKIAIIAFFAFNFLLLVGLVVLTMRRFKAEALDGLTKEFYNDYPKNFVPDFLNSFNGNPIVKDEAALQKKLDIAKQAGSSLEELDLAETDVTSKQLHEVLKACPNLQKLNLFGCKQLKDADLKGLPKDLQWLNLSGCKHLTDEGMKYLPSGLQSLKLSGCEQLTDEGMKYLPKGLQSLIAPDQLTDEGIKNLPSELQALSLYHCNQLTDKGMKHLPKGLKALKLPHEPTHITDVGIKDLPPTLQFLSLDPINSKITDKGLKALPKGIRIVK